MSKKQTRKRFKYGGAASYQKARIKPTHKRETRSKTISKMFKQFQNLFTRKQKVQPVDYKISSENLGGSSPIELVISSNSNREATPFIVVDVPRPRSSKGSRVLPYGQDFTSAVIVGRGLKNANKKKSKKSLHA